MDTPRKRNGRGAADPNPRADTITQTIGRPRYEWSLSRKTRNNKIHSDNGNPKRSQPHTNPNPKQNPSPSHHPALLLQRHTKTSPARSTARAALRTKWAAMIRLAKGFRIFKIGDASSMTIKRRLIAYLRNPVERADNPAENHPNLLSHPHGHRTDQPESLGLNPGLI